MVSSEMFLSYKTIQYIHILFSPNIAHRSQGIIVLNHKNIFKMIMHEIKQNVEKHKINMTGQNKVLLNIR